MIPERCKGCGAVYQYEGHDICSVVICPCELVMDKNCPFSEHPRWSEWETNWFREKYGKKV